MKILCSLSGIEYECSHFPFTLHSRESHHPVFDIPQKKLLPLIEKYHAGEFTSTDSYLYYLALFRSSSLVEFRVPAIRTTLTASIVALNIDALAMMVGRMNVLGTEKVQGILNLPRFVISSETKDLATSDQWIRIWESNYEDYQNGYVTATMIEKLNRREAALERFIKDKSKDISEYAGQLAEWASLAGEFFKEDYDVLDEYDRPVPLEVYWKRIIKLCAKGDSFNRLPMGDLKDIYEYCQENTSIVSSGIYGHCLLTLLKVSIQRKESYYGLGDVDLNGAETTFRILDASTSVEDANKLVLIDSAPKSEPKRSDYPSPIAFLRAKLNYAMAQDYIKNLEALNANQAEIDAVNKINSEVPPYTPPIDPSAIQRPEGEY